MCDEFQSVANIAESIMSGMVDVGIAGGAIIVCTSVASLQTCMRF